MSNILSPELYGKKYTLENGQTTQNLEMVVKPQNMGQPLG